MKRWWLLLALVATVTFCIGPFFWQALTSIAPEGEEALRRVPSHLVFDAYGSVFTTGRFAQVLGNSLFVAGTTTALCVALASLAAFALARLPLRGKKLILACALGASMFPPIATVSPLFLVVRALGLRDSLWALVLSDTTFALPLALWILTSFFRELPEELYRAARVDGCSPFQAFWRVLLPLAAPGIVTTGLLVFVFAWNEFLYALTFISSPGRRTVPVAIALFTAEHKEPWAEIAAASVIATLPLVVLTLIFQRRLVAGLTAGAVKG